jgi:transcriptional regulator with GAF, ATPase, and Fis domain
MYDHPLFLRTLSEFTRTLLTPYDVDTMFAELATRVTDVLALAGSGVSLFRDGRLELTTVNGADAAELGRVQERTRSGPCATACHRRQVVAVPDLAERAGEWPEFCRTAAGLGIHAVASIPMEVGEDTVGALDLYAGEARPWPEEDLRAAKVLADMATVYLVNASYHRRQVELNEQLQQALESRLVIEQAKGVLVARHGIGPEQAFERIRARARGRGASVHAVAAAIVNLGLDV